MSVPSNKSRKKSKSQGARGQVLFSFICFLGSHLANFWKNLFTLRQKSVMGHIAQVRPHVFKLEKTLKIAKKTSKTLQCLGGQVDFGKLELNSGNHSGNCLFTGTFYRQANYSLPKQVPSRACYYSPSQMYSQPSTLFSSSLPPSRTDWERMKTFL